MLVEDYPHKIKPFDHQLSYFREHVDDKARALFWEQGTAKTKPIIDTICFLYLNQKIDAALIVAPPGVERNWKSDELPTHMILSVSRQAMIEIFQTAKKHTANHKNLMNALIRHAGLSIALISYSAFMTKDGKKFAWDFLNKRKAMMVLDESHHIKSPNAKRTKSVIAAGKYAVYKRILTGTPYAKGPFDIYSQVRFLDNEFWKRRDIAGSVEFRSYFGEWLTAEQHKEMFGYDPGYDQLQGYKNLDQLKEWMDQIGNRVEKSQVLDLPPKLYSKIYFEMTKEQKKVYDQLRDEYIYEFENGGMVDGSLALVRLLRFQQVLSNYVPTDLEPSVQISTKNPRLESLEDRRDNASSPGIVWSRFTKDIDQLMDFFGGRAVRYDGTMTADEAERSKLAFQAGDADWFVGNQQKGSEGLTLHMAKTVDYFTNSFNLVHRLQSEDRAHRAGMDDNPVLYTDIICPGTADEGIVSNLRDKKEIADFMLGNAVREWI